MQTDTSTRCFHWRRKSFAICVRSVVLRVSRSRNALAMAFGHKQRYARPSTILRGGRMTTTVSVTVMVRVVLMGRGETKKDRSSLQMLWRPSTTSYCFSLGGDSCQHTIFCNYSLVVTIILSSFNFEFSQGPFHVHRRPINKHCILPYTIFHNFFWQVYNIYPAIVISICYDFCIVRDRREAVSHLEFH